MYTEDDLGEKLNDGTMTVDEVVALFAADPSEVVVYPVIPIEEGTETWADVEDRGARSTLFHDLHRAGATPDQMDEVGAQIIRARTEGRTMDKVFGWSTEAMTPEGSPVTAVTPAEPAVSPENT